MKFGIEGSDVTIWLSALRACSAKHRNVISSLVELTKHSGCTTHPVSGWRIDFLADWNLYHNDEVSGLTSG